MKKRKLIVFLAMILSTIKIPTILGQNATDLNDSSGSKVPAVFWIDHIPSIEKKSKKNPLPIDFFNYLSGKKLLL